MTEPSGGVRGAARSRGGATDTTVLIWKVIAANPGIDRAGIWERVEHGIPEGYALRRYANSYRAARSWGAGALTPQRVASARKYVLTETLKQFRHGPPPVVTWEGCGDERRYTVTRELRYTGNKEAIDETGTKAADHMELIDARRTLDGLLARCNPGRPHAMPKVTLREHRALVIIADALRGREVPP